MIAQVKSELTCHAQDLGLQKSRHVVLNFEKRDALHSFKFKIKHIRPGKERERNDLRKKRIVFVNKKSAGLFPKKLI